mmetsp:Transcript_62117/g.182121  ORF Transcript_62117/g.182121 Transcript_62117/m.182121 type:complete len:271 (+) Transcript_62117:548-1360(+)
MPELWEGVGESLEVSPVEDHDLAVLLAARRREASPLVDCLDVAKVRASTVEPVREELRDSLDRGKRALAVTLTHRTHHRFVRLVQQLECPDCHRSNGGALDRWRARDGFLPNLQPGDLHVLVVDASSGRGPRDIRERTPEHNEEVEGVVVPLIDDLAGDEVGLVQIEGHHERQARRHIVTDASRPEEHVLHQLALVQRHWQVANHGGWEIPARDHVLHRVTVEAVANPGAGVKVKVVFDGGSRFRFHLGMDGVGFDEVLLFVYERSSTVH